MQGKKKQSLFKQRLQQNKDIISKEIVNGFPTVVKIDTHEQIIQQKKDIVQKETGFLDYMMKSNLINQQEYKTINESNDKYLNGLKQEQIKALRAQILQQVSPSFLSKMKLQKESAQTNVKTEIKITTKIQQKQQIKTVPTTSLPPTTLPLIQQQFTTTSNQLISSYQLNYSSIELLQNLTFNVESLQLTHLPRSQNNPKLIEISQMLNSQNNQTILVGIKLFKQILQLICSTNFNYEIAIINGRYYHRKILMTYLKHYFIEIIWSLNFLISNFQTIRTESLLAIVKYLNVGGEIDSELLTQLIDISHEDNIKLYDYITQIDSTQILNKTQNIEQILLKENFKIVNNPLSLFFTQISSIDINSILPIPNNTFNILTICQKLLLQQLHLMTSPQLDYLNHIDIFQQPQALSIIFLTIQYLKFKYEYSKQQLIKTILKSINILTKSMKPSIDALIHKLSQSEIFRLFYVFKYTNNSDYIEYLKQLNSTVTVEKCLFILNIEEYLNDSWSNSENQLIQQALISLMEYDSLFEFSLLFDQLSQIFLNQKQSYFQLNQPTLNTVFHSISQKINIDFFKLIVHPEKMRRLVQAYIFNSFGNIVFSKVVLFYSNTQMNQDVQLYTASQVYQRYPAIMMEAGKTQLFGNQNIYNFLNRSQKVKQQLRRVRSMVQKEENNNFYKLLGNDQQ